MLTGDLYMANIVRFRRRLYHETNLERREYLREAIRATLDMMPGDGDIQFEVGNPMIFAS